MILRLVLFRLESTSPVGSDRSRGDRRSTRFEAAMLCSFEDTDASLLPATQEYAQRVIEDWELLREIVTPVRSGSLS
jgi:hypothetical protein